MRKYVFALRNEPMCEFYFDLNSYQLRKIEEFIAYSQEVNIEDIAWWIKEDSGST